MSTTAYVHLHGQPKISSRAHDAGGVVSITIEDDASIFAESDLQTASLVVATQQAHDALADTGWSEAIARQVTESINGDGNPTSATLAESGPSVLVDHVSGRSFVLYVREV